MRLDKKVAAGPTSVDDVRKAERAMSASRRTRYQHAAISDTPTCRTRALSVRFMRKRVRPAHPRPISANRLRAEARNVTFDKQNKVGKAIFPESVALENNGNRTVTV